MGARVAEVVAAAVTCFADLDAAAAERLPTLDQAVDRLNDRVFTLVARHDGTGALAWVPQVVLLARFLERLGDQAVDIGEQTRFVATGEVRELLPSKAARIPAGGR
jgi:phosphate transport system protein